MKADAASHLLRQPVSFELFLFFYLVFALILQKINIYKTNFHLIDFNLVIFTIVILGRRLGWCILQELQSHWTSEPKKSQKGSSKSGLVSRWLGMLQGDVHIKRLMVVLCTLLVILWSVVRLIQHTPLFNLLFLFYPLLLYLSLFGFTLEPRMNRTRFEPPKTFLQHINFGTPERQRLRSQAFSQRTDGLVQPSATTPTPSAVKQSPTSIETNIKSVPSQNTCDTGSHNHVPSNENSPKDANSNSAPVSGVGNQHGTSPQRNNRHPKEPHGTTQQGLNSEKASTSDTKQSSEQSSKGSPVFANPPVGNVSGDQKYTWEYALMLPTTPDEVRNEVDVLLSDLIVRLKQLLFNSLLCAYYVGFIPMQFADSHLYYDKWWCVEHAFLVWANSFVILASILLSPSYCQLLYHCTLHLGCWTRCVHDQNTSIWSPNVIWRYETVVQWNGESFKGEGVFNMAIPCDSSQEFFYLMFRSRLQVHTWLLTLQCITVLFQIVVLLRSVFWYQLLSMSVFLIFNSFVFYKLLYNRLWARKNLWLT